MQMRTWLVGIVMSLWVTSTQALTADELVTKYIEARGGMDKLSAVQTLKRTGKIVFGGRFELTTIDINKRPHFVRNEATMQGMTAVEAYDGKEGWQIDPFGGRKDPEKQAADDIKERVDDADIDGALVNYQAKGSTLEYQGTEDVDGTQAHKLKLTQSNGDVQIFFLDPDHFLTIRKIIQRKVRGVEVRKEIDYGDYEEINGVFFPFSIESGDVGATEKRNKITLEKIEVNLPIDESIFHFPTNPNQAGK